MSAPPPGPDPYAGEVAGGRTRLPKFPIDLHVILNHMCKITSTTNPLKYTSGVNKLGLSAGAGSQWRSNWVAWVDDVQGPRS